MFSHNPQKPSGANRYDIPPSKAVNAAAVSAQVSSRPPIDAFWELFSEGHVSPGYVWPVALPPATSFPLGCSQLAATDDRWPRLVGIGSALDLLDAGPTVPRVVAVDDADAPIPATRTQDDVEAIFSELATWARLHDSTVLVTARRAQRDDSGLSSWGRSCDLAIHLNRPELDDDATELAGYADLYVNRAGNRNVSVVRVAF